VRAPTREFGGLGAAPAPAGGARWRTPPAYELTPEQRHAVAAIEAALRPPRFAPLLLDGVTGSGKTEVYLHAIRTALAAGRGALVLVPEISLTPQTVDRFRSRFGDVAVLHSMLTPIERAMHYGRLRAREVRVAIGARSAIFAPIPELGLIVVDECHEESYKQESAPRYHARDVAVVRASQLGIPVVLGSATPAFESRENVARGRYIGLHLPHRVTAHGRAAVEIVDRRAEPTVAGGAVPLLGPRLVERLREAEERGEQSLLFLNRRGFARRIHCPRCGYQLRCSECDIGLTYHKREDRSLCHYCGTVRPVPDACPDCAFPGIRRALPGTERIEEALAALFPGVAIGRLDRDTATSGRRLEEIIARFRSGATRILVGTQMVAKGHDIPGVTLVGVIDADVALGLPDFRAAERTAQLLCQVAGRAGRGDRPGRVVIQTHQPEHYALIAAAEQDLEIVRAREAPTRRLLLYPPYGHLVRVLCEDPDEERALACATELRRAIERLALPGVKALGPAPAPFSKLRGRYRHHLLLKSRERKTLHRAAEEVAWGKLRGRSTRIVVDVDPVNLM
jgi:primosomal protein N' (replication factor Y)